MHPQKWEEEAVGAKGLGIDCGYHGVGEALTAKTLARDGLLVACYTALTVFAFAALRAVSTSGA